MIINIKIINFIIYIYIFFNIYSKDVISRWTFPLTPDSNIQQGDNYRHSRNQIYKDQSVILAR